MLETRYEKTDAGRAEIRNRALVSARTARNLLLVITPDKPASQWLAMVQGAGGADLQQLLDHGLIAPAAGAPASAPGAAAPSASTLSYEQLYTFMSGEAVKQLGPFRGYAFALEVERCQDLAQLQRLAQDFVARVQANKGDAAAQALRRAMGLGE